MVESKTVTTMKILSLEECKEVSLFDLANDDTFQSIRFPKTNDGSKVVALLFAEAIPVESPEQ